MQASAIVEEHGFSFIRNLTRTMIGWARAQLGRAVKALRLSARV
jgi:hypothetical protein